MSAQPHRAQIWIPFTAVLTHVHFANNDKYHVAQQLGVWASCRPWSNFSLFSLSLSLSLSPPLSSVFPSLSLTLNFIYIYIYIYIYMHVVHTHTHTHRQYVRVHILSIYSNWHGYVQYGLILGATTPGGSEMWLNHIMEQLCCRSVCIHVHVCHVVFMHGHFQNFVDYTYIHTYIYIYIYIYIFIYIYSCTHVYFCSCVCAWM